MDKAYTTLLILLYILLTITPSLAQPFCNQDATLCSICSDKKGSDFVSSGTYKENLQALLLSFPTMHPNGLGYYKNSRGSGSNDQVTVIGLCRGDIAEDTKLCQSCLNDTATWVLKKCPTQKEAIIWGEKCTVKYSNDSNFHLMEKEPILVLESSNNYTADVGVETFNARLKSLLGNLTMNASSSAGKCASGSVNVTQSRSIYSLVQCIPSLTPKECSDCLESSSKIPDSCCGGADGARVLKPSCTLRYERASFYSTTAQVSPTTNHTSFEPPTETDGNKNSKDKIVVPVLSSVIGVVVLSMLVHGFP